MSTSVGGKVKAELKDSVHISGFDKGTIMNILGHAGVKALLKLGEQMFLPFKGKTMAIIFAAIHESSGFVRDRVLCTRWSCIRVGPDDIQMGKQEKTHNLMLHGCSLAIMISSWLVCLLIRWMEPS